MVSNSSIVGTAARRASFKGAKTMFAAWGCAAASLVCLSACGQKGALYLPTEAAAQNRATLPQLASPLRSTGAANTPSSAASSAELKPAVPSPKTPTSAAR